MTSRWARAQAQRWARRLSGHRWLDLTKEEQAERRAAILPVFEAHLAKGWADLAAVSGVPQSQLESTVREIREKVEWKFGMFVDWRLARAVEDLQNSGEKLTAAQEEVIRKVKAEEPLTTQELRLIGARNAERPIAEQQAEHELLSRVTDEVGFACLLMQQEEVELSLPAFDAGTDDAQFSTITVDRFPGLLVEDAGVREYPFESATVELDMSTFPGPLSSGGTRVVRVDGVACHILGRMRDMVYETDVKARKKFLADNPAYATRAYLNPDVKENDRGSYRNRDRVGREGIEFTQEHWLRPLRGVQTRRLDTGDEADVAPESGKDLHLTLDIALQAKIQAIMDPSVGLAKVQPWQGKHSETQQDGDPLYGAVVVIDIDSGEILAMVSTPTYTREQIAKDPKSIYGDDPDTIVSMPGVNKAIAKAYVPGSIVKAMMLTEAQTRGLIPPGHAIDCTGHLFPDKVNAYRCWIYKQTQETTKTTHNDIFQHAPNGPESLMVSCNIYFYTLGRMLGPEGIVKAYQDFGVGTRYNLGIGYEHAGQTGRKAPTNSKGPSTLINTFDAIQMGIGQGPVTWTPVHAADAYATLARGGVRLPPRIIRNGPKGGEPIELGLKSDAINEAIEGLRLSVNDHRGTGNHVNFDSGPEQTFNVPGIKVWGKTGTATASPIKYDPDGSGPMAPETLEEGDHSWFVVLAGKDKPQYAVAVVIDFGGSGGKVSGPIVNQVLHALQAEGYFEGKN